MQVGKGVKPYLFATITHRSQNFHQTTSRNDQHFQDTINLGNSVGNSNKHVEKETIKAFLFTIASTKEVKNLYEN